MEIEYRTYKRSDYSYCEDLVNRAWGFDDIFTSKNLQKVAKTLYTRGSEGSSNYKVVAICEGQVVGFIFGLNCAKSKPKRGLLTALKATFDLNTKKMDKSERKIFVESINKHHKNRLDVTPQQTNEIVLFVVKGTYQGMGIGKQLWKGFKKFCAETGQENIRVETNRKGASGFYEGLGFRHQVDFNSPLHELATPGGQACIYEYTYNIASQQGASSGTTA